MELLDQLEAENPEDAELAPKVGLHHGRTARRCRLDNLIER
jgi:hypothetical protein